MWSKIKKLFTSPTPEEHYQNGRNTADRLLFEGVAIEGRPAENVAAHIYAMGFGVFNETTADKAFDRGIQDRLNELGYEAP
ncbi:hypothetical protein D3C76_324330 [compost metagenome]